MFGFDKYDIQRMAVSAVGAVTLTAATVFAAEAPARGAVPAPAAVHYTVAVQGVAR